VDNNRLDIENRNLLRDMKERDGNLKTIADELSAIKADFVWVSSCLADHRLKMHSLPC